MPIQNLQNINFAADLFAPCYAGTVIKEGFMQKVVDYRLFTSDTPQGLTDIVKEAMTGGWVPSGVIVKFHAGLIQAMVKFEEQ